MNERCGLCGKSGKLTKTECCGKWICDDEDKDVLFSYARNSYYRNHKCFTLCGFHHVEGHKGDWKSCDHCREEFETEMYVYYGTNEYNFEKLLNPPSYEPTHCAKCGEIISLGEDGYSMKGSQYFCTNCSFASPEEREVFGRALSRMQEGQGRKGRKRRAPARRGGK